MHIGEDEILNGRLHYTGRDEEYSVVYNIPKDVVTRNIESREVRGEKVTTIPVTFSGSYVIESARVFGFVYILTK